MSIKYVIGHWTGVNSYNITDIKSFVKDITKKILESYQIVIGKNGEVVRGLPPGHTASTGGMNSITYNISCAGGDIEAPMTKLQMEKFYFECARILRAYCLDETKFYTHAEIGKMVKNGTITKLLPNNKWLNQNIGKIDLTRLPYDLKGKSHGDFIRSKIKWYLANM